MWAKSSHSAGNANCVESAQLRATIALRDSKNPDLGHLSLPPAEWSAFLSAAKRAGL